MNSRYFEFNNVKSVDMDYHIVNFSEDFYTRTTYGGRNIDISSGNIIKIKDNPLEKTIILAKMDCKDNLIPFNTNDMDKLSRWLIHDEFKELRFGNDINKVYYAMVKEISPLKVDRSENGFVEITFITNKSHAFTNKYHTIIDVKDEKEYEIFSEFTIGDKYFPKLRILANSNTDFKLKNLGTNQCIEIKGLKDGEMVFIDNGIRYIKSNDKSKNVFKDFNKEWLWFRYGSNLLSITGNVRVEIMAQYPII